MSASSSSSRAWWGAPSEIRALMGVDVPWTYSSLAREVEVVRTAVGVSALPHWFVASVTGEDAFDVIDRVVPPDLHLREGQMKHTLLLNNDDARPLADVYLAAQETGFLLVVDGMSPDALRAHLAPAVSQSDALYESFEGTHVILSLNGPFAWELLAEMEGPNVIGLPYLSFYCPDDDRVYFRAGRTGEFGYDLMVPRARAASLFEALLEKGKRLGAEPVGVGALHHCALENFFYNIHAHGMRALTPYESQLQWRVSPRKDFPGASVLRAQRTQGAGRCVVGFESTERIEPGAVLTLDGVPAGEVLVCERSCTVGTPIGIALIDRAIAHSGVGPLRAGDASVEARTVSPPFIHNMSLFVNPQKHAFQTRAEVPFPGSSRLDPAQLVAAFARAATQKGPRT